MRNGIKKILMASKKEKTYIKDGLQLWLDGIENTRNGHANTAYSWQDLSGNNYDFSFYKGNGPAALESNCLRFGGSSLYRCQNTTLQDLLLGAKERTIEIVCSISEENTNAKTIFLGGKSSELNAGVGMWYRPASGGMCISGNSYAYAISDVANPHTYSAVYNAFATNSALFYKDNVQAGTRAGGTMANNYPTIGGREYGSSFYAFIGKIYCIRVYDRQLTQAEREHNRKIDIERFGI